MTLELKEKSAPQTTTDAVFEYLHDRILTLKLLPGARISEADVAAKLGVSRQPVRDAFNRLSNLNLLKIRPQRATVVSGFSISELENARFVRLAVELEVARSACQNWNADFAEALDANLYRQRAAIEFQKVDVFHQLDYEFHKLICVLAGHALAFDTILDCKRKVDRLCMLSLASEDEAETILDDHERIAKAFADGSREQVELVYRHHFGRLDSTIKEIHEKHLEYFDEPIA